MTARPEAIEVYTDGGCIPNPGRGAWAYLVRTPDGDRMGSGCEAQTTNNRMELKAAIEALRSFPAGVSLTLHTDSEYVRRGITEWLPGWRARGWKRKTGAVANQELWQELEQLTNSRKVHWKWVRGHSGHAHNERVDAEVRRVLQAG